MTIYNFDLVADNSDLSLVTDWSRVSGSSGEWIVSATDALSMITPAGVDSCYVADSGATDHSMEITYATAQSSTAFPCCVRVTDQDNFIGVRHNGGDLQLFKRVANTFTPLGTDYTVAIVDTDRVRLDATGDELNVYLNDALVIGPVTDAFNNTETQIGVVGRGATLSNLVASVEVIGAAATPTVTDVDAMAHGSSSNVTVSNFAAAATTGNSTLTSGTVVLTPSSVAGSVLTFPISRLDLQEGSYTWTLDIAGETASTGSVAYTIDGNGTDEFYGTVTDQAAWIAGGYTAVVNGDNIYAVRTSGTTTPVLASCSFTGPSTWDIYIQDVADNVWGSSGTLTVPAADLVAPVITLLGSPTVTHAQQAAYTDAGATASDDIDGDITGSIVTVNPVDVNTVGSYTITYNVDGAAGNSATQVTRTVNVTDQEAPTITLTGSATVNHAHGTTYTDAGSTAADFNDGDVTGSIVTVNPVNSNTLGAYTVTYNVSDAAGNAATEVTRTVNVTDQTAPVITLTGNATVNLTVGDTYIEQGATWTDAIDGSGACNGRR